MIQVPNDLRELSAGAMVNLFVSVGQTSRRLKGTVEATHKRGTGGEVLEVHVAENNPGASRIVFWVGFTDEETYLLPLEAEDSDLVYVKYKHNGGQTGLYIDDIRDVGVEPTDAESTTAEWSSMDEKARIDRAAKSEGNSQR